MTGLRIAPDLELPLDAVTETFAILAKRGSGKTYTAAVIAEEMLEQGLPVCVVDPLGVWWGLRSSADGKTDGYPVVIFGGDHADVPLEETAGKLIADVLIDQRFPAVLDLSLLSKSATRRFMTDFLVRLQHRNRDPLHVIVDEADMFAPQSAEGRRGRQGEGDGNSLLGAMEDLIRRGRARGIGATLITQRPAVIHKDVLSQAEVLIALRMTGTHDVGAIDTWVKLHDVDDQAATVKKSLPALPVGTAWVWSPGWLGVLQQVKVRRRRTFDSSATPKMGERRVTPKARADVDLEQLGEQIAATVERAKADDPKELRRRITQLERDLAAERAKPAPEPEPIEVPVPVLDEQLANRIANTLVDLHKHGEEVSATAADMLERLSRWEAPQTQPAVRTPRRPAPETPVTGRPRPPDGHRPPSKAAASARHEPQAQQTRPAGDGSLGKGERTILIAVAQYPTGVTREQLTVLTGYKRSSRDTYLQRLRQAGHVDVAGGTIRATQEGIDALGGDYEPLPTGRELQEHWLARLPEGERRILEQLIYAYPTGLSRDQLSEATGYKRSSRDTYLQRLRSRQLVTTVGTGVIASEDLFDGGAR